MLDGWNKLNITPDVMACLEYESTTFSSNFRCAMLHNISRIWDLSLNFSEIFSLARFEEMKCVCGYV